jgi:hypothetical protein
MLSEQALTRFDWIGGELAAQEGGRIDGAAIGKADAVVDAGHRRTGGAAVDELLRGFHPLARVAQLQAQVVGGARRIVGLAVADEAGVMQGGHGVDQPGDLLLLDGGPVDSLLCQCRHHQRDEQKPCHNKPDFVQKCGFR